MPRSTMFSGREYQIPKGAIKVGDKASDAIAYLFDNTSAKPCAMIFYGKQSKPVAHFRYRSAAVAADHDRHG